MCGIIHVSLQRYHHGISFKDVKVLVDEYIDEGGSQLELFMDVLKFKMKKYLNRK